MFIMHISVLLAYGVLLGSAVLIIWSLRNKGAGSTFGKVVGSLVFALSLLSVLCIAYSGLKFWSQGNFESDMTMGMRQEMMKKMMPMMMEKVMPQMMEKMMDQMGKMPNTDRTKDTDAHPKGHS